LEATGSSAAKAEGLGAESTPAAFPELLEG
jgi:hypothetical protein